MELLNAIGKTVKDQFRGSKRVLTFGEYLELAGENPRAQLRGAAQYLADMFEHFGWDDSPSPGRTARRSQLFDAPWADGQGRVAGQEEVQVAIHRSLRNFVRQGRVDRILLLTGPNGSAKSTITEMVARGMESYSALPEGATYRFNWIFPTEKVSRGGIGFAGGPGGTGESPAYLDSFAHLEESQVDARLPCEMGDHPLLLVPKEVRGDLLEKLRGQCEDGKCDDLAPSVYLADGDLCPKCKLIYEALLGSYEGDFMRLLRHVQVERFYASRRYRQATSRVEPQLAADAQTRQVTADRSLSALPTALQNINLFELDGHLVRANRGVVDFSDLLKRPIEHYKYLLIAVEEGRVMLDQANIFFDLLFLGSSNESHLNALMETPEWTSFKARMELVKVPYLRDYTHEAEIYDAQVAEGQVGKHVAPHTTRVAALWAVLSRMYKPKPDNFDGKLKGLVKKITPMEKAEMYARGKVPGWARGDDAKLLKGAVQELWQETANDVVYEGRIGPSPREMKTLILHAGQDPSYGCLSPNAVLDGLARLVKETSVYAYLRMEAKEGYQDFAGFIKLARGWYLDRVDREVSAASGLVAEESHHDLFSRYLTHVLHQTKGEKVQNPVTGDYDEPDQKLLADVEKDLEMEGKPEEFRGGLISRIGAWSVDNSGEMPDYHEIFPAQLDQLRDAYFRRRGDRLRQLLGQVLMVLSEDTDGLEAADVEAAQKVIERLTGDNGYCTHCAREAVVMLMRERYPE